MERGHRALRASAGRGLDSRAVAELKPAYLVCGDDDAKIDAWRARVRSARRRSAVPAGSRLRRPAERPEEVAAALATLTFDPGTRYLLVDDAGAWKAGELEPLEAALASCRRTRCSC